MAISALGCQPESVLPFLAAQRLEITRKVLALEPAGPVPVSPSLNIPCKHSCFPSAIEFSAGGTF